MNLQDLRKSFEPALRRVFHLYWRFARGMTLGVRAVVLDGDNRVFLVKHSYVRAGTCRAGASKSAKPSAMRWCRTCKRKRRITSP